MTDMANIFQVESFLHTILQILIFIDTVLVFIHVDIVLSTARKLNVFDKHYVTEREQ